jgi:hypothetical protein
MPISTVVWQFQNKCYINFLLFKIYIQLLMTVQSTCSFSLQYRVPAATHDSTEYMQLLLTV